MIGIQDIGVYIPQKRIDNLSRLEKFDVDASFITEKAGMLRVAVKGENEESSDLCEKAFLDLQRKTNIQVEDIDCMVVCTQNPDGFGLPHTSAIVHQKLGLTDSCAVFDISLGCSGFVYSLSIIQGFMQANGFRNGVLITADPYSKIVDKNDKNTTLLFGDAATATLINDTPTWKTGKFVFGSNGQNNQSINVDGESRQLTMNGRAVFTFTATVVPKNITTMLSLNELSVDDVDCFALHQGSRFIVNTIKTKLGVDDSKVPFVAADYGNTVSSSIPLILSGFNDNEECVVIAGFGVGLSWGSTVLFKINK